MKPVVQILADPRWLAHRYDPAGDLVQFIEADRNRRSRASFLSEAEFSAEKPLVIGRQECVAAAGAGAPLHYIFHSAYCCSTLLARAFDLPGLSTSLKEPQILNDLVGWRHRGASGPELGNTLSSALALLARPFEPDEAVVVKPSNVVNGLVPAMLQARPASRAVLLHAPLDGYLASIAGKGMWGRIWVRDLLLKLLADGLIDLGFNARDHMMHTDLQVAAVGWLAQQALFARIAREFPGRVLTLDSETLVASPQRSLAALAGHFGLQADSGTLDAIVAREFSRDAKEGTPFAVGQRTRSHQDSARLHGDEIDKVSEWAAAVGARANIPMELPAPLLARL